MRHSLRPAALALALTVACAGALASGAQHPDHYEFDAAIDASFRAVNGRYPVTLFFDYPGATDASVVAWTLDVVAPDGRVVASRSGMTRLGGRHVQAPASWNGREVSGREAPAGYYTLRLRAVPTAYDATDYRPAAERAAAELASNADAVIEQSYDVQVGDVAPARTRPHARLAKPLRESAPLMAESAAVGGDGTVGTQSVPAPGGLAYTIHYGNFHSQTNHSDGGGALSSCTGSQGPQAGAFGPVDAFTMMDVDAQGDFLLASEHNHMYDGSTSTNTSATPASANGLFDSGVQTASNYRAASPSFMALYGLEWGVISNGGHLNILNPDVLANWELNASGQLLGGVNTPKSDYPALYATMKQRGWVGQFNHPATTGQFLVNGTPLGYDANGADVMALVEILNSSAFSTNTSETETSRSSYVGAWNLLLERGYKVAPATNQDNHCANWGLSFTNRTGVLLPSGTPLSTATFLDAVKARRVFATEDRAAQLVLTANDQVMGSSFANSGALTLTARYASAAGQTVQRVQFFQGVPGRNGAVTQLAEGSDTHTLTPATGEHFYYALVTQANGLRLWSAPVWVSQGTATADTTAPTATASVTGSSGAITLAATASDNVGVAQVEFLVDGVSKGVDTTAPYAVPLDSTTLTNGSHTLVARARDAAGNVGDSASVTFNVSNTAPVDTTAPTATASVTGSSGAITLSATASDNVGVAQVDFLVDGASKGIDTTTPYSVSLDSRTLADGSHTLIARARDAAGNVGDSAPVSFNISNAVAPTQLILNGGFESGATSWTASKGVITNSSTYAARTGTWKAWLNGLGSSNTEFARQQISVPSSATTVTLGFWLRVASNETTTTNAFDVLRVQVRDTSNKVLGTLGTFSNLNKGTSYIERSFDVSAYRGQTVRIYFEGVEGSTVQTSFLIDDVSVLAR